MLSMSTWKSAGNAANYYAEQVKFEYYPDEKMEHGRWRGGVELGLADGARVNQIELTNILKGFDRIGEAKVRNAGDDHRPGYDLTFSAPKSVSALWAHASPEVREKVLKAHQKAVQAGLDHVEKYAARARRGVGGKKIEPVKKIVVATFDHATSRENDPHLHTHALVANMAQRMDGTWGGLESSYLYREKMGAGAIYRSELAHLLQKDLGVAIERKGREFEIVGFSQEHLRELSKRRTQIEHSLAHAGYSSAKAAAVATLDTRREKEERPLSILREGWQEVARTHEFDQSQVIHQAQHYHAQKHGFDRDVSDALKGLTQSQSTFTERELRREIALESQGKYGRDGVERAFGEALESKEIIYLGHDTDGQKRYTTHEVYRLERNMFDRAMARAKEHNHTVSRAAVERTIERYPTMREEQRAMVRSLTTERGGVKIALGGAGSGKSFSLKAAGEIWKEHGFQAIGLAPTGKAAQGLEDSAKIESRTIDSFLLAHDKGKEILSPNHVLVVDEAGMLGSRKMDRLLNKAHKACAKVVLVGDHRQLQPIEAGGATRMLRQGLGASELETMERQKIDWQREATHFFAEGKAQQALDIYAERGQVRVFKDSSETRTSLVDDYVKDRLRDPSESRIVLAETNAQVRLLNNEIRHKLLEHGELKEHGASINIKNRDDELEQREFARGDRIYFTKNDRKLGVSNGTFGEIKEIKKTKTRGHEFLVKTDSGKMVAFSNKDYKHIEYGYAVTVYKSQGDTVDRAYFMVCDRSSREASYVAMSRHRKNATLYLDRTNFSENIDWSRIRQHKSLMDKLVEIEQSAIKEAARSMSKKHEKETSMDYAKQLANRLSVDRRKLIIDRVWKMAQELDKPGQSRARQVKLVYDIAVEFRGSEHPIKSPPLEKLRYQEIAERMIKENDFSKESILELKNEVLKHSRGVEVSPNHKMREHRAQIEHDLGSFYKVSQEQAQKHDRSHSHSQSRGFGFER